VEGHGKLCDRTLLLRSPLWVQHLREHGIDKQQLARKGLVEWVKFAYQ
jgi:hypothetical protein